MVVLRLGSLDAGERTDECGEDSCDILGRGLWRGGIRGSRVEADEQEDEDDEQEALGVSTKLQCVWPLALPPSLLDKASFPLLFSSLLSGLSFSFIFRLSLLLPCQS